MWSIRVAFETVLGARFRAYWQEIMQDPEALFAMMLVSFMLMMGSTYFCTYF